MEKKLFDVENNFFENRKMQKVCLDVYEKIVENFSETYLVGGAVRDFVLGRKICEVDVSTIAQPSQVVKIFENGDYKIDLAGEKFGVVCIWSEGFPIEVASFRVDEYEGKRFPKVRYCSTPEEDSLRRDFTLNSLYLQPILGEIKDFHKGMLDIKNKIIRTVDDPDRSFRNDPLRMVRALRFSSELGFIIEEKTKKSLSKNLDLVKKINFKRIEKEISKIKTATERKKIFLQLKNLDT